MRLIRLILCAATLAAPSPVRAEVSPAAKGTPPPALSRTLRTFDFEERDAGNVEDTPVGWVKVEGPGLPHYLHGQFDQDVSAAGRASFRFDLNGGSVTYRYPAKKIAVMPHATYRVSVMCRTTPLKHARARLTGYFCDIDGRAIAASITASEPLANEPGDETFHPLTIELAAGADAASLVLELGLLQPALLPQDNLGEDALLVEDIRGSAWFDELRVAQVPEVTIATDRATNIFRAGEPVNIRVWLRDRIATDLSGELRIFDVDGRAVFQRTGTIDFSVAEGDSVAAGDALLGTVVLPQLGPGWYDARLTIRSNGQFVADHSLKFVQLGNNGSNTPRPDPRFGLVATGFSADVWPLLPAMVDELAAGRVKLSAWSKDVAVEGNGAAAFDRLLDALGRRGVSITACLSDLPAEVRKSVGGDRWIDLLRAPPDRWQPQLAFLIARHATHLTQWQLMDDDAAEDFAASPELRAVFDQFHEQYSKLIGTPDLAMPWPAWFDLDERAPATIALSVPSEILPEQLPLYINDVKSRPGHKVSLTLHPIDRERYGREAQMRDLALRVAYALAGGADRIDLPLPMKTTRHKDGTVIAEPDKLLVAQRVITQTLSNARYAGKVPIAKGVDAFLFQRGGRGVMLVSTRSQAPAPMPPQTVSITLGRGATRLDLYGNATPLPRSASADKRRPDDVDLVVGALPAFVTDIDAGLMLLRASLAIDNPMLESSVRSHGRTLTFRNTFDYPITGSVRLSGPPGWTVSMPAITYSLNPGEQFEAPITIDFPLSSSAGEKEIVADVRVQGVNDYRFSTPLTVKLGLTDVGLQTVALRSGNDIVVQQLITNYGTAPINYNAFIAAAGMPRQERIVSNLGAGKTTIRKYRLVGATTLKRFRSGVREVSGKRMLNEEVEVN